MYFWNNMGFSFFLFFVVNLTLRGQGKFSDWYASAENTYTHIHTHCLCSFNDCE